MSDAAEKWVIELQTRLHAAERRIEELEALLKEESALKWAARKRLQERDTPVTEVKPT